MASRERRTSAAGSLRGGQHAVGFGELDGREVDAGHRPDSCESHHFERIDHSPTRVTEEAGILFLLPVTFRERRFHPHAAAATTPFGDKAEFFPHFVIRWQLSFDGGNSWDVAGQSDNPLYVSASTEPLPDFYRKGST